MVAISMRNVQVRAGEAIKNKPPSGCVTANHKKTDRKDPANGKKTAMLENELENDAKREQFSYVAEGAMSDRYVEEKKKQRSFATPRSENGDKAIEPKSAKNDQEPAKVELSKTPLVFKTGKAAILLVLIIVSTKLLYTEPYRGIPTVSQNKIQPVGGWSNGLKYWSYNDGKKHGLDGDASNNKKDDNDGDSNSKKASKTNSSNAMQGALDEAQKKAGASDGGERRRNGANQSDFASNTNKSELEQANLQTGIHGRNKSHHQQKQKSDTNGNGKVADNASQKFSSPGVNLPHNKSSSSEHKQDKKEINRSQVGCHHRFECINDLQCGCCSSTSPTTSLLESNKSSMQESTEEKASEDTKRVENVSTVVDREFSGINGNLPSRSILLLPAGLGIQFTNQCDNVPTCCQQDETSSVQQRQRQRQRQRQPAAPDCPCTLANSSTALQNFFSPHNHGGFVPIQPVEKCSRPESPVSEVNKDASFAVPDISIGSVPISALDECSRPESTVSEIDSNESFAAPDISIGFAPVSAFDRCSRPESIVSEVDSDESFAVLGVPIFSVPVPAVDDCSRPESAISEVDTDESLVGSANLSGSAPIQPADIFSRPESAISEVDTDESLVGPANLSGSAPVQPADIFSRPESAISEVDTDESLVSQANLIGSAPVQPADIFSRPESAISEVDTDEMLLGPDGESEDVLPEAATSNFEIMEGESLSTISEVTYLIPSLELNFLANGQGDQRHSSFRYSAFRQLPASSIQPLGSLDDNPPSTSTAPYLSESLSLSSLGASASVSGSQNQHAASALKGEGRHDESRGQVDRPKPQRSHGPAPPSAPIVLEQLPADPYGFIPIQATDDSSRPVSAASERDWSEVEIPAGESDFDLQ